MFICAYIYIYIFICAYTDICIYLSIYLSLSLSIYIYIYTIVVMIIAILTIIMITIAGGTGVANISTSPEGGSRKHFRTCSACRPRRQSQAALNRVPFLGLTSIRLLGREHRREDFRGLSRCGRFLFGLGSQRYLNR